MDDTREKNLPGNFIWIIAVAGAILAGIFLHTIPINNSDFFWHLEAGKYIVETGSIPHVDPFSYTAEDTNWVTHEWLFEVVTWIVYSIGSFEALCVLKLLFIVLSVWFPISLYRKTRVSPVWLFVCIAAGLIILQERTFWRPFLISTLFISIFVTILENYANRKSDTLWLLPILTVIWINWHSGVIFGLLFVFYYTLVDYLGGSDAKKESKRPRSLHKLALVAGISLGCTLINPNFTDALLYPIKLGQFYSSVFLKINIVEELQPLTLNRVPAFWFSVLLIVVGLITSWKRLKYRQVLLLFVLVCASIYRIRLVEIYVPVFIAFVPGLIQGLSDLLDRVVIKKSIRPLKLAPGIAAVAVVLFIIQMQLTGPPSLGLFKDQYPEACADWIERFDPEGYMYNHIDNGGYLTHRLYPDRKIFWDGRLLVFGDLFSRLSRGETIEDIHPIDWVVDIQSETGVNPYTPDQWALVTFEKQYALYIKRTGAAASLIDDHEYFMLGQYVPEHALRNAQDFPREIQDQIADELERFLDENDTLYCRSYAAGVYLMLGGEYVSMAKEIIDAADSEHITYVNYQHYSAFYDFLTGEYAEAERKLRVLLFWWPKATKSQFLLGRILAAKGDYSGADRIFSRIISGGYRLPAVYFAQANVLYKLGDTYGATGMLDLYFQTVHARNAETREYADAITLAGELLGNPVD